MRPQDVFTGYISVSSVAEKGCFYWWFLTSTHCTSMLSLQLVSSRYIIVHVMTSEWMFTVLTLYLQGVTMSGIQCLLYSLCIYGVSIQVVSNVYCTHSVSPGCHYEWCPIFTVLTLYLRGVTTSGVQLIVQRDVFRRRDPEANGWRRHRRVKTISTCVHDLRNLQTHLQCNGNI